jgi:hypothetical protein
MRISTGSNAALPGHGQDMAAGIGPSAATDLDAAAAHHGIN